MDLVGTLVLPAAIAFTLYILVCAFAGQSGHALIPPF